MCLALLLVTVHPVAFYWGFGHHARRRGVRVTLPMCLPVAKAAAMSGRATSPPKLCPAPARAAAPRPALFFTRSLFLDLVCCTLLRAMCTTRGLPLLLPLALLFHGSGCFRSFVRCRHVWMTNLRAYSLVCFSAAGAGGAGGAGLGSRTTSCTGSSGGTFLGSCRRLAQPPRSRRPRRTGLSRSLPLERKPLAQGLWWSRGRRRRRLVSAAQGMLSGFN